MEALLGPVVSHSYYYSILIIIIATMRFQSISKEKIDRPRNGPSLGLADYSCGGLGVNTQPEGNPNMEIQDFQREKYRRIEKRTEVPQSRPAHALRQSSGTRYVLCNGLSGKLHSSAPSAAAAASTCLWLRHQHSIKCFLGILNTVNQICICVHAKKLRVIHAGQLLDGILVNSMI